VCNLAQAAADREGSIFSIRAVTLAGVIAAAGCGSTREISTVPSSRDVVVVDSRNSNGRGNAKGKSVARTLKVPPGHYPPPGECRLWYAGRPPGQQPAPTKCQNLLGRVPKGAFILYNSNAWDADYDWAEHVRMKRGAVPEIIVRLTSQNRGR